MNLFGKKKANPPKVTDSIQQLREASEMLDKREKHLDQQINQTIHEAKKKMAAKDKRGALFLMKRKKMLEKQRDGIWGKKSNIETQILALEEAVTNKEVFKQMKTASSALKGAIHESDVDNVNEVMDQVQESLQLAGELSDAMSQPLGAPMDEDELEAELAALEDEVAEDEVLKAPTIGYKAPVTVAAEPDVVVPKAPTKPVEVKEDDEARDLRELEALMNA